MPIPLVPLFALAGVATTALAVMYDGRPRPTRPWLLRELQGGDAKPIASLRPKQIARVIGVVSAEAETTAPISGRPCIAWEVSVWQPIGGKAWKKVGASQGHVPFVITDASGKASVRAEHVEGWGVVDHEQRVDTGLRGAGGTWIARLGLERAVTPGMPLHFKESVLEEGERAVLVGIVEHHRYDDGTGGYRDRTDAIEVVLTAPPQAAVMFSDAPEAIAPEDRRP